MLLFKALFTKRLIVQKFDLIVYEPVTYALSSHFEFNRSLHIPLLLLCFLNCELHDTFDFKEVSLLLGVWLLLFLLDINSQICYDIII